MRQVVSNFIKFALSRHRSDSEPRPQFANCGSQQRGWGDRREMTMMQCIGFKGMNGKNLAEQEEPEIALRFVRFLQDPAL